MRPGRVPRTPARTSRWRWRWTGATPCSVMRCVTGPRTWRRPRSSPAPWTDCRVRSRPRSSRWPRSGWSATRPSSGPVSWPGSAGGSWTWSPPRSPTPPKPDAWPPWRRPPTARPGSALRRVGDGTTRITGLLPDAAATRLATYLEAFTNPRKDPEGRGPVLTQAGDPLDRLPYPRRLGEAFLHLLEVVDPKRLPVHGGDATTLLVTMTLDQLRTELATAEVIGASHVPGDDDGCYLTAAEARRLACNANHHPRRPGRAVGDPGPGPRRAAVHRGPAQGTAPPRPDLPRRGLRHPRHLVRGPPLEPLGTRRSDRPRQRRPALPTPPPTHPRRRLPRRTTPHRRHQIPPTQIEVSRPAPAAGSTGPAGRAGRSLEHLFGAVLDFFRTGALSSYTCSIERLIERPPGGGPSGLSVVADRQGSDKSRQAATMTATSPGGPMSTIVITPPRTVTTSPSCGPSRAAGPPAGHRPSGRRRGSADPARQARGPPGIARSSCSRWPCGSAPVRRPPTVPSRPAW